MLVLEKEMPLDIWKDTKNADAAKLFLEYMARPEVAKEMNAATGKISCLKSTMDIDDGYGLKVFQEMKEKCADCDIFYENLWDRQYMPIRYVADFRKRQQYAF